MPQKRCRPEEIIAARPFSAASSFTGSASEGQHSCLHLGGRRRYLRRPGRHVRQSHGALPLRRPSLGESLSRRPHEPAQRRASERT
jgi:hypothetical protein